MAPRWASPLFLMEMHMIEFGLLLVGVGCTLLGGIAYILVERVEKLERRLQHVEKFLVL